MLISEALKLKDKAFISLVGAGGKSSILQILTEELREKKKRIILTTTTKMFTDQLNLFLEEGQVIESFNAQVMEENIKSYFQQDKNGIIILLNQRLIENGREKFTGPKRSYLNYWWREGLADFFIVEADGARGRPIKAPTYYEPVVPKMTTDLVGVIGIEAVGLRLGEENVFRSSIFSSLTGLKWGKKINTEVIVALINHPAGLFKNSPKFARRYLFLNKVNNREKDSIATEVAFQVMMNNQARINAIIIGDTLQKDSSILKVVSGKIT
ncbi:MAG: selenium cofactor biosynthesis protein YqeC [Atribacterota bacterium]|nr:selenium cofactor biosynthesis protein YqeC [Atribacterota bacterium]MDD5636680.1 selenium cofactor biosynthesis protein YqeC [Atribacterota bacterium]